MSVLIGIGRWSIGRVLTMPMTNCTRNGLLMARSGRLKRYSRDLGHRYPGASRGFLTVSVLYQEKGKSKGDQPLHSHSHEQSHEDQSHTHSPGSVFGHSHSHSAEDNVFLQEKGGLKNPAIRITCVGLMVNVAMAVGKGVGGVVFHSQALLADSVHALSDLVSDFLTLATISIGSRPVSETFPNGFGKFETLGSLGVSTLLVLAGISMGWSGLITMMHHLFGDNSWLDMIAASGGHSHSHSHGGEGGEIADLNAAWLALASIGVKEWLYFSTIKVAEQTGSNVLVANAWHHRIDSLVSMVAVATIGGGYMFGVNWLDPLGGLIVSCVIVRAGYSTAKQAALELADSNLSITKGEALKLQAHREKVISALENIELQHTDLAKFAVSKVDVMPSGPNIVSTIALASQEKSVPLEDFRKVSNLLKRDLMLNDKFLRKVAVTIEDSPASLNNTTAP